MRSLQGNKAVALAWIAVLVLAHPALFVAAAWGSWAAFAAAMAAALLAEHQGLKRAPLVFQGLGRVQLSVSQRYMARDAAVIAIAVRDQAYGADELTAVAAGLVLAHMLRGMIMLLRQYVHRRRTLPLETRNLNLAELRIPDLPPDLIMQGGVRRPLYLTLPVAVGVLADLATGFRLGGIAGTAVTLVTGLVVVLVLISHARRVRHLGNKKRVRRVLHRLVADYGPEVALYYSSSEKSTAYQVDMWISTLSRLERKAIVIVRERMHMAAIRRTHLPIICLPTGGDVADLEMPALKVALYVGNVGKNIHLLRNPEIKHVFVGHGDSDKLASANPASKVYDEVWVAGRAGRDRYRRAAVGVRDEAIVEVGRPQLDEVRTGPGPDDGTLTVLYAPTFEGWSKDMFLTSVLHMGEELIRILLADPAVRVVYKPHPLIGVRSAAVRRAHRNIMRMLGAANAARRADPAFTALLAQAAPEQERARMRSALIRERMAELTRRKGPRDATQRARESGVTDPHLLAELDRHEASLHELYWAARGPFHTTVQGPRPSLYSCFNQAHLMISDISSVVSDFIASEKPYVVTNQQDLDAERFRADNTAAGGAYLLGSKCTELQSILDAVRGPGDDPMAPLRRQTREYLLGPEHPDAMTRFNEAVERLVARRRIERLAAAGFSVDGSNARGRAAVPTPRLSTEDEAAYTAQLRVDGLLRTGQPIDA